MASSSEPFAFNFSVSDIDGGNGGQASPRGEQITSDATLCSDSVPESKEISILPFHERLLDHVSTVKYSVGGSGPCIHYVSVGSLQAALARMKTHSEPNLEHPNISLGLRFDSIPPECDSVPPGLDSILELLGSQHTDLIPGVYEGGMKIWECAFDLIQYMSSSLECGMDLSGKSVMELGCGAGLPAIYALMKGAASVGFQDFNSEVIHCLTIPNVLLNTRMNSMNATTFTGMGISSKCKFYSGDWNQFSKLIKSHSNSKHYDIILTSETIYSESSQPKLLAALKQLVEPTSGTVLVAAKTYYFGVGGGVAAFKELLERDGYFSWRQGRLVASEVPRIVLELTPRLTGAV